MIEQPDAEHHNDVFEARGKKAGQESVELPSGGGASCRSSLSSTDSEISRRRSATIESLGFAKGALPPLEITIPGRGRKSTHSSLEPDLVHNLFSPKNASKRPDSAFTGGYFRPNSTFVRRWGYLREATVLIYAIAAPYIVSFVEVPLVDRGLPAFISLIFIQVLWIIDVVIRLKTLDSDSTSCMSQEELSLHVRRMRTKYWESWLGWFDLLSTLPIFGVICLWMYNAFDPGFCSSELSHPALCTADVLTLFGLFKTARLLEILSKSTSTIALFSFPFMYCLFIHWVACAWNLCANPRDPLVGTSVDAWATVTQQYHDGPFISEIDGWDAYVAALQAAFLLISGEDVGPQTNVEKLCAVFVNLMGVLVQGLVIALVLHKVERLHRAELECEAKLDRLKHVIQSMNLPRHLQIEIESYLLDVWQGHGTLDVNGDKDLLLSYLPPRLKFDALLSHHKPLINTCWLWDFEEWNKYVEQPLNQMKSFLSPFLFRILEYLEHQSFPEGDRVIREGEQNRDVYFVQSGTVEIKEGEKVVNTLEAGSIVGEYASVEGSALHGKRSASVDAKTFLHTQRLREKHLDALKKEFSRQYDMFFEVAEARFVNDEKTQEQGEHHFKGDRTPDTCSSDDESFTSQPGCEGEGEENRSECLEGGSGNRAASSQQQQKQKEATVSSRRKSCPDGRGSDSNPHSARARLRRSTVSELSRLSVSERFMQQMEERRKAINQRQNSVKVGVGEQPRGGDVFADFADGLYEICTSPRSEVAVEDCSATPGFDGGFVGRM